MTLGVTGCKPPLAEFKENTLLTYVPDLVRGNCATHEPCSYFSSTPARDLVAAFQKVSPGFTGYFRDGQSDLPDAIVDQKGNAVEVSWVGTGNSVFEIPDVGAIDPRVDNTGWYWTTLEALKKKWHEQEVTGRLQADNLLRTVLNAEIDQYGSCGFSSCSGRIMMNPSMVETYLKEQLDADLKFDQRGDHTYEAATMNARITMEPDTVADQGWFITARWGNQP